MGRSKEISLNSPNFLRFPRKLFGNSWGNVHVKFVKQAVKFRLTCGESNEYQIFAVL